jgi:hypothetical protein
MKPQEEIQTLITSMSNEDDKMVKKTLYIKRSMLIDLPIGFNDL